MTPLEVNLNPSSGIINLLGHGWISKSFCVKSKIVNSDFSNPSTENEIPLLVSRGIEFLLQTSLSPFFLCIMQKDYNYIFIFNYNCYKTIKHKNKTNVLITPLVAWVDLK